MMDNGDVHCCACEVVLPITVDVFLCRSCMDRRLPGNLRHDVLTVEEPYQWAARRRALEFLGVELVDHKFAQNKLRWLRQQRLRHAHDEVLDEKIADLENMYTDKRRINLKTIRERSAQRCRCKKPFLIEDRWPIWRH